MKYKQYTFDTIQKFELVRLLHVCFLSLHNKVAFIQYKYSKKWNIV